MKSLKRKALSNASALPAILLRALCLLFVLGEIYTSVHLTWSNVCRKKTKRERKKLDVHGLRKNQDVFCHFQTNVISVVFDLQRIALVLYILTSHISDILYPSLLSVTVSDNVVKLVFPPQSCGPVCRRSFWWHLNSSVGVVFIFKKKKKKRQKKRHFSIWCGLTDNSSYKEEEKNTSPVFLSAVYSPWGRTCAFLEQNNERTPRVLSPLLWFFPSGSRNHLCRAKQSKAAFWRILSAFFFSSSSSVVYKYNNPRFLFSCCGTFSLLVQCLTSAC